MPPFALSPQDLATYRRDGAVLIKGALDTAMLKLLELGLEEAYAAQIDRTTRVGDAQGGETVVRDYASQDSRSLAAMLDSGLIGAIAAALIERSSAHLILDQIFYKTCGPIVPTPWHQDTPFLRVRGEPLVRLWMPIDRSPADLTVQVVRGSHRWNVVYGAGVRMTDAASTGTAIATTVGDASAPAAPDVRTYRDSFDILSWDVEPGDVLAFQGNMLHGTDGRSRYDAPRRAFAVLLGGPDLRYHKPHGNAFPSPGRKRGLRERDDIPQGAEIGDFESAFPACWRENGVVSQRDQRDNVTEIVAT